jgi:hypothetical protein
MFHFHFYYIYMLVCFGRAVRTSLFMVINARNLTKVISILRKKGLSMSMGIKLGMPAQQASFGLDH